jgi:hypothetical protein
MFLKRKALSLGVDDMPWTTLQLGVVASSATVGSVAPR